MKSIFFLIIGAIKGKTFYKALAKVAIFVFALLLISGESVFSKSKKNTKKDSQTQSVSEEAPDAQGAQDAIGQTQEIEERLTNASSAKAQRKLKKSKSKEGAENVVEGEGEQKLFLPQGDKKLRSSRTHKKMNITELVAGVGAFTQKDISAEVGKVKLVARGKTGAVQLYAICENGHAVPIFSNYNHNAQSTLWVKLGSGPGNILKSRKTHEEVYKLVANPVITTATRASDGQSVLAVYVLRDKVRVVAKYEAIKPFDAREAPPKKVPPKTSEEDESAATFQEGEKEATDITDLSEDDLALLSNGEDAPKESAIKVTLTMENRGHETNVFALKQVLNTRLGEGRKVHFSTNNDKYIASQVLFNNFDWEGKVKTSSSKVIQGVTNWVTSTNDKVFATLITAGRGVSALESLTISSTALLNSGRWDPPLKAGESFDGADEWGDSAISLYWGERRLAPRQKIVFTYYIALAVMDEFDCNDFIDSFTAPLKEGQKLPPSIQINVDLNVDEDFSNGKFVFDESTITGDKINYDYIQTLLDRINEIESSGDIEDNRNELLRLNAEIDIILDKLKK